MTRHFLALHDFNEIELYGMLTLARELKGKQKNGNLWSQGDETHWVKARTPV